MQNLVHCLHCGRQLQLALAHQVFKTGFYKVAIPLAICQECHEEEERSEAGIP